MKTPQPLNNTTEPQQAWQPATAKPLPPLTNKQQEFVRGIVEDKLNKTEAYIQAYDHKGTRKTANEEATRTARKPQVKIALDDYTDKAKLAVLEVLDIGLKYGKLGGKEGASYLSTALQASNSVIDRVEGKAQQRINVTSTAVTLSLDLTGTLTPVDDKIGTSHNIINQDPTPPSTPVK